MDTILAPNHLPLPLASPVGALMRPTHSVAPEDSIGRAAAELRLNGGDLIPVTRDGILFGVVTESVLARVLADDEDLNGAVRTIAVRAETIAPYETGAEALRRLAESIRASLVVVDDHNHVLGLISATDLIPRRRVVPRPAMVGGMATPFGVYLTNGVVKGGASGFALLCTGALMFTIFLGAVNAVKWALPAILSFGFPAAWSDGICAVVSPVVFLATMRLIPLSGTHGAEHQVVHALERGEDLVPDIVRRMPRVHPRCGTNLATGASIFLGVYGIPWIPNEEARLIVAFITTMVLWRRVGSFLQEFLTTRPPSERQINSGIKAAQQLLERYARAPVSTPSIPVRLWNSGMFHVMAGSSLMAALVAFISWKFNLGIEQ